MKKIFFSMLLLTGLALPANTFPGTSGLYIPRNIQKAYQVNTRSPDGKPGPKYWQNRADYSIDINFNPLTRILKGKETITYYNNSPDTLNELLLHLFPNYFKKGSARDDTIDYRDESPGVTIEQMTVNNVDISPGSRSLQYEHTNLKLLLANPLPPGKSVVLSISWHYTVNKNSHNRTGAVDASSFFIAYFFPRIAVFDDIHGWNDSLYTGTAEFYNDFGNFEVSIAVPRNFIVWATGTLQNPGEVLTPKYLQRFKSALFSDDIVHIINAAECTSKDITAPKSINTWKFRAENVCDFAFAASNHYQWDAASLVKDKTTDRRVFIDAAYANDSRDFPHVAAIARQAIEFMSFEFPGYPFPFPKETVFQGLADMEYPMMVNDGSRNDINAAVKLTFHEIFHSYFPFFMGCNETKYAWMDEGLTSMGDYLYMEYQKKPDYQYIYFDYLYKNQIGHDLDTPIFTRSDILKSPVYYNNAYSKAAAFFLILRDFLGADLFKQTLLGFMNLWNGKHPSPYDLFYFFQETSGQEIEWLIEPWFFEYGYVDLAVKKVSQHEGQYLIVIEKIGKYPTPIQMKISYADGSSEIIHKKASVWKNGNRTYTIKKTAVKIIKSVELPEKIYLDADMTNNRLILEYPPVGK
jgi:hypothetical protein